MPPDASAEAIRVAYRERARRHHPDRGAERDGSEVMSAVNEAYRVLGDPARRAVYDRALTSGRTPVGSSTAADVVDEPVPAPPSRDTPLSPSGPARLPWKWMLVAALAGSAIVLLAAAFTDPPSEEPPDGILRIGSCVAIEANGDAREVECTGADDIVVRHVLPTGARCPAGLVGHRDRLGLGTACIEG